MYEKDSIMLIGLTCSSELVRLHHEPFTSFHSFITVNTHKNGCVPSAMIFFASLKLLSPRR